MAETYDVESLTEIDWPHDDPFTRLVLDKKDRNKIMANCRLAKSRRESPDLLAEQLGGKGAGTVMLLHGWSRILLRDKDGMTELSIRRSPRCWKDLYSWYELLISALAFRT